MARNDRSEPIGTSRRALLGRTARPAAGAASMVHQSGCKTGGGNGAAASACTPTLAASDTIATETMCGKVRGYQRVTCLAMLLLFSVVAPGATAQIKDQIKPEQCLGGTLDAPILIEVFSDFECTHCRDFFLNTISLVLKEYCSLNKVCVVYHEFPWPNNQFSRRAAQFSKAAQKLGREQWRAVMQALYENQSKWSFNGSIDGFVAQALSPDDYSRLKSLLRDPAIDEEITREVAQGEKRKVTITPTLFVYALGKEQKVSGVLAYPVLKNFFDSALR
jgi:protein-disulfide isomerase